MDFEALYCNIPETIPYFYRFVYSTDVDSMLFHSSQAFSNPDNYKIHFVYLNLVESIWFRIQTKYFLGPKIKEITVKFFTIE